MVELHVRGWLKAIHALPLHILASIPVSFEFLDFWFVRGNRLMARHAHRDARDLCIWSLINAGMAVDAFQPFLKMNLVSEGNWLNRRLPPAKKLTSGRGCRFVFWSKNIVTRRLRRVTLRIHRRAESEKHSSQNHRDEHDHNTEPHNTYTRGQRRFPPAAHIRERP
jgi:hypothetical protein